MYFLTLEKEEDVSTGEAMMSEEIIYYFPQVLGYFFLIQDSCMYPSLSPDKLDHKLLLTLHVKYGVNIHAGLTEQLLPPLAVHLCQDQDDLPAVRIGYMLRQWEDSILS